MNKQQVALASLAMVAMVVTGACYHGNSEDAPDPIIITLGSDMKFDPEFCVFKLSDYGECVVTASDTCELDKSLLINKPETGLIVRAHTYDPLIEVYDGGELFVSIEQTTPTTFLLKSYPVEDAVEADMYFSTSWDGQGSPEEGLIEIIVNESGTVPE